MPEQDKSFDVIIHTDIDECSKGSDGCGQTCTNIIGSYSCSCDIGYRLASDGHSCNDINECALGSDGCAQTCTNTIGSYRCSCNPGYRLESDGHSCGGKFITDDFNPDNQIKPTTVTPASDFAFV